MNLTALLNRRPFVRSLHRVLVFLLIVSVYDLNERTLLGMPMHLVPSLFRASEPLPVFEVGPTASSQPGLAGPTLSWALGELTGPWTRGFAYDGSSPLGLWSRGSSSTERPKWVLAQGNPVVADAPGSPPCFVVDARAKSRKVQLVWSPVPDAITYEIFRGANAEPVVFGKIGEAAGNLSAFLDGSVASELTHLYFVRAIGPGIACDSDVAAAYPTTSRRPANYPPVIYSTPPLQALSGASLVYDINAADPNVGDIVRYSLVDGPAGMRVDPDDGLMEWSALAGTYLVTVEANDENGGRDLQTFSLVVSQANRPPLADAGADQTATTGQAVFLDGSLSSDLDGDPLAFFWTLISQPQGSAATLSNPSAVNPEFIIDLPGTYLAELIVNDGFVNSAPDSVTISTQNSAPVANAGSDQTATTGQTVVLDGSSSSDVDGDPLTFAWTLTTRPPGSAATLSNPSAVNPEFIIDLPGTYLAELIVNDGFVNSAPDSVTISTQNSAPVANAGPDQTATTGQTVGLDGGSSSDVDGDPLTFAWTLTTRPPGSAATLSNPSAVNPEFIIDLPGTYLAELVVNDGFVNSAPDSVTISTQNSAPVAHAGPDQTATTGQTVILDGSSSSDVDGDPLTFAWTLTTRPPGSAATLSNPSAVNPGFIIDLPGTYLAELVVNDGFVNSAPDSVTISTQNSAPVAHAGPDQTATTGQTVILDGSSSSDVDGDPLTFAWTLTTRPPGSAATLSNPSAVNPEFVLDLPGTYLAELVVNDGSLDSLPDSVVIGTLNSKPVAQAGLDLQVTEGDTVGIDGSNSSDVDGDALTYQWSILTQPPGGSAVLSDVASVNPTFVANVAGDYLVQLIVNDGFENSEPDSVMVRAVPRLITVPNVVGLTQAQAEAALQSAELTVGLITTSAHPTIPAGMVVSQDPAAGSSVSPGASVAIVVSTGAGAPALVSIEVTPTDQRLHAGEALQFAATGTWSDQHTEIVTDSVQWRSTHPEIATLSIGGLAGGLEPGLTSIEASLEGITGRTSLSVEAPALVSIVVTPPNPIILTLQSQQFHAIGILTDGTSQSLDGQVTWESMPLAVAEIDASGLAIGSADGTTTIQATKDGIAASTTLTVRATLPEATPPIAQITSPANNTVLTSPVDIVGTANDDNFVKYVLDYAVAGQTAFTTLVEGGSPVVNGVLGLFDGTLLLNDLYTVRLTVFDRGGNTTTASQTYQVARDQKVGIFTLTFQDLNIPLAGLPIAVNRVYDSRDKSRGDFGIGWRLDIQTIKARANRVQGTGWQVTRSGGFFPTYTLVPTDDHKITITLPDGKVEEFELRPTPSSQQLFPLEFVTAVYTPRFGTLGTLVPLGDTDLLILDSQPGPVTLLEFSTFETYNPSTFQYTSVDGKVFVIDKVAGVQSVREPNGNTLTFGPNAIVHSSGKSIAFARDGEGRITQVTDPNGNEQHYIYDTNGDLVRHINALDETVRYLYNLHHGFIEMHGPQGTRPIRNEYDEDGRLIAHIDAEGHRIEYSHDPDARQEIVQDRLGGLTSLSYDSSGNILSKTDPLGNTTSYTYDANGNKLSQTDALGNTSTFTYDSQNNVLTETDSLGATVARTYNSRNQVLTQTDALGRVTTMTYDANGNLLSVTDPLGNTELKAYDAQGNLLSDSDALGNTSSYQYDPSGHVTRRTDPLGHVTTYQYDANGNQTEETTSRTDSLGNVVAMTARSRYDAKNRLVQTIAADGNSTAIEYNAFDQQSAIVDRAGNRTRFEYSPGLILTRTLYPDGTAESYAYDANGRKTSFTDRNGQTTTYAYDLAGRLTATTYPGGEIVSHTYDAAGHRLTTTDGRNQTTTFLYDAAGRVIKETDPLGNEVIYAYDDNGNVMGVTDGNGHTTRFEYSNRGQRVKTIFHDQTSATISYDALGRKTQVTDQAGVATRMEYEGKGGRLVKVNDALGGQTSFTYDERGNKLTQTDANGNVTRWIYDDLGRVTRRILPLGMSESFAYDANGNVTSRTDFDGNSSVFTYDSNNRLTRKVYPDGSEVSYEYAPTGQRLAVADSRGTTRYAYLPSVSLDRRSDFRGAVDLIDTGVYRLQSVIHPDGSSLSYEYDESGNRTSVTLPSGVTRFSFDAGNRLASVVDADGATTTYTYDLAGNRSSVTSPNGTRADYTYDSLNRLVRLQNRRPDQTVISSYEYTVGPVGNRLRVAESGGRSVDYSYDSLYRLLREDIADPTGGNQSLSYTYDAVGNRLTRTDSQGALNYSYDANDRMLTAGSDAYLYDGNGNLVRKVLGAGTTFYDYDFENRLVSVRNGANQYLYAYDADGIQVGASINGTETRYLVDKNRDYAEVLEERSDTGVLLAAYVHGDDLISQDRGGAKSFYHFDGLGSTRALTDASGTTTDTYTYEAFGNLLNSTGNTINTHLFTGERFDPNLGFYYLRARYYSPESGRFITADPFEGQMYDPPSLHKYTYTANNPVNAVDPSGKWTVLGVILVVALLLLLAEILFFFVLPRLFAHKDNIYLDFSEMSISGYDAAFIRSRTVSMVTADYAPYKVTVTSSQPASSYKHIHIGGDSWFFGDDTFGWTYWNRAYVYTDYMVAFGKSINASQNDVAAAIGNTTSHEAGHSFTLGHDSTPHIMEQGWKTDDRTWSQDSRTRLEKVLGLK